MTWPPCCVVMQSESLLWLRLHSESQGCWYHDYDIMCDSMSHIDHVSYVIT